MRKILMFRQTDCPYCIADLKKDLQHHHAAAAMTAGAEQPGPAAQHDHGFMPPFWEGCVFRVTMEAGLKEARR